MQDLQREVVSLWARIKSIGLSFFASVLFAYYVAKVKVLALIKGKDVKEEKPSE